MRERERFKYIIKMRASCRFQNVDFKYFWVKISYLLLINYNKFIIIVRPIGKINNKIDCFEDESLCLYKHILLIITLNKNWHIMQALYLLLVFFFFFFDKKNEQKKWISIWKPAATRFHIIVGIREKITKN